MAQVDEDCIVLSDTESDAEGRETGCDSREIMVAALGKVSEDSIEIDKNASARKTNSKKRIRSEDEGSASEAPATPRSDVSLEKKTTPATRPKKPAKGQQKQSGLITSFFKLGPNESSSETKKGASEKQKLTSVPLTVPKNQAGDSQNNKFSIFNDKSEIKDQSIVKETFPDLPLSHDGKIVGHIASKLKDHQVTVSIHILNSCVNA